jgi:type IV pilus assembly protein PilO
MINLLNKFSLDNKKIFLLILLCLIIVCIDFTFIIKLQLRGIGTVRAKIIKLKKDIDSLNKDLIAMQQAKQEQIAVVETKKIISEEEIPSLLQDISNTANKYNVKIMQLRPSRDTETKEKITSGRKLLVTLDLLCGYHSLGSFINDLENAERFITVQEMKIVRSSSDYLYQNVNLVLKTYVKE